MNDSQLKNLFDYTKFHIGMYTTLTSALLAVLRFNQSSAQWLRICIVISLFCFLVAGACGGAIASNIPNFKTFADFEKDGLEVFGIRSLKYRNWAHFEHGFFWIGIVIAVVSIAISVF
jgi:hypothetical protein